MCYFSFHPASEIPVFVTLYHEILNIIPYFSVKNTVNDLVFLQLHRGIFLQTVFKAFPLLEIFQQFNTASFKEGNIRIIFQNQVSLFHQCAGKIQSN